MTNNWNRFDSDSPSGGGGGATTEYDGITDAALGKAYKDHKISEAQYKAELKSRDKSDAAINLLLDQYKPIGITPPSLPGGGLADPKSGVQPPSPYAKLSESELQQYVEAGIISREELIELKGEFNAGAIMAQPLSSADKAAIANLKKSNPQVSSSITGSDDSPTATTSSRPSGTSGGGGTGGGGGSPSTAKAVAPPPVPNSAKDLQNRGALAGPSGAYVLQGQQYRAPTATVVSDGKSYYIRGADGTVQPTPFSSEAAAKAAIPMVDSGAAIRSKTGVSPAAKIAQNGGSYQKIENPLFNTFSLDESIAASATRGSQGGELLGTSIRKGYPNLDIMRGGIPEYGGLMAAEDGTGDITDYRGQLPGNVSIGQSSIAAGGGPTMHGIGNSFHFLQQQGMPLAAIEKAYAAKGDIGLIEMQQGLEYLRSTGLMPDLESLRATYETSGGLTSKWGPQNGGAANTPYDKALAAIMPYMGNDLEYFPDVPQSGNGSTQVGNTVSANSGVDEFGRPLEYGKGGAFTLNEPSVVMGLRSRKPYALLAEAGKREKVTIEPQREDITMSREMGMRPLRGGKPQPFKAGGQIYAGLGNGFEGGSQPIYNEDGTVTEYGASLGYKSDPWNGGGGVDSYRPAPGQRQNFTDPLRSASGEPVNASYDMMSPETRAKFADGPPGLTGTEPVSYQIIGGVRYPVYTQPGGLVKSSGLPDDYNEMQYSEFNNAGMPALYQQYGNWQNPENPGSGRDERDARYLMALLNGGDTSNLSRGNLSFQDIGDGTNKAALLAKLYAIDPALAFNVQSQMIQQGQQQPGGGQGGVGGWQDPRDIEDAAARERYRMKANRNLSRAGLPPWTVLDVPRQTWTGEGDPPWGAGNEAPYQRYNLPVRNGFVLPDDYNVQAYDRGSSFYNRGNEGMGGGGMRGGFGGGGMGGGRPWNQQGGQQQGGGMVPWRQQPWYQRNRVPVAA